MIRATGLRSMNLNLERRFWMTAARLIPSGWPAMYVSKIRHASPTSAPFRS
jgi:hypothetical protein